MPSANTFAANAPFTFSSAARDDARGDASKPKEESREPSAPKRGARAVNASKRMADLGSLDLNADTTPIKGLESPKSNSTVCEKSVMRRLAVGHSQTEAASKKAAGFAAAASLGRNSHSQDAMRMRRSLFSVSGTNANGPNTKSPKSVFALPGSPVSTNAADGPELDTTGSSIAIEGNIGVGKSTFLKLMRQVEGLEGNIVTMPEPVTKWQNVGGNSEYNLLQRFYESPHR